jgi:hypothetical protein
MRRASCCSTARTTATSTASRSRWSRRTLDKKLAKGVYDHEKAKKLWGYVAENCAKKYAREMGDGVPWHKMFSTADRREVAKAFAESFRDEHVRPTLHGWG